jgi:hypothetical protein
MVKRVVKLKRATGMMPLKKSKRMKNRERKVRKEGAKKTVEKKERANKKQKVLPITTLLGLLTKKLVIIRVILVSKINYYKELNALVSPHLKKRFNYLMRKRKSSVLRDSVFLKRPLPMILLLPKRITKIRIKKEEHLIMK